MSEEMSLPVANPAVIFRALSDGAVLFSTTDEVYFGLNAVGARVWELLPPVRHTLDEVCNELVVHYPDADRNAIRADVTELLDELANYRLVLRGESRGTDETSVDENSAKVGNARPGRIG